MNHKNSILYINNDNIKIDKFSERCKYLLELNWWNENAIDLTNSIIEYKLSDNETRKYIDIVLEIFFILESEIISLASNEIITHAGKLKSSEYLSYALTYTLNEITHAKFYTKLYSHFTAMNINIDNDHIKSLYDKYENNRVFYNRVNDIINVNEPTYVDFIKLSCIEGIKFMSLFEPIFYYSNGDKFNTLAEGNRWVSIDEFVHSLFHINMAVYLFELYELDKDINILINTFYDIITENVEDEIIFIKDIFHGYPNINNIIHFTKWLGNKIYHNLADILNIKLDKIYKCKLPVYMESLLIDTKESLHDTVNTNYIKLTNINSGIDRI